MKRKGIVLTIIVIAVMVIATAAVVAATQADKLQVTGNGMCAGVAAVCSKSNAEKQNCGEKTSCPQTQQNCSGGGCPQQ
ncbi:MAG: hypothetical protein ACRCUS_06215 [Anaerovoracaceae bacterium]